MGEADHPSSWPPYAHQTEAEHRLAAHANYALLMEMGTGKTRPVIRDWWGSSDADLLVIAPTGCYANWTDADPETPGELEKWLAPEEYAQVKVHLWARGKGKTIAEQRRQDAFLRAEGRRALVMNVEALVTERARRMVRAFLMRGTATFVIDESTCVKGSGTVRTTFVQDAAPLARRRRILTGLVAPESPLDVFEQFWFLDWRILGYRSVYAFTARYAVTRKVDFRPRAEREQDGERSVRKANVVVGYRHQKELQAKIAAASYRVLKSDALDLPPKVYMPVRSVEMTDEQARMYAEMKRWATTQLEGRHVSAKIAADVLGKLHAVLCGHVRDEAGVVLDVPSRRSEAVLEVLQDHSGKAVVWAPYPRLLEKLSAALKKEWGELSTEEFWGATTPEARLRAKHRIQEDPRCRFIVANQAVGGEGNTWTAATLTIYAANSWKNKDRQQSEDRPHRAGQTETCTYVDLAVEKSVEWKLIHKLRDKMDLAAALTGDVVKEWLV